MMAASASVPAPHAILKALASHCPDRVALVDPADNERVLGETPRRFTYAQADRAVGAIAARLREIGLAPGSVVAVKMPNVAANVLILLGIMRAGMIAAPLPLLWHRADCAAALTACGARAIITCGTVAGIDHATLALDIAAELFPIRAVCGFGCGTIDGIVPFDDLLSGSDEHSDPLLFQDAAAPVSVVTFDMTVDGIVPVGRDDAQLLAGGRLVRQRGEIGPGAVILSTIALSTYAALSAAFVPWLLDAGTLVLAHPFDPDAIGEQVEAESCSILILPEAMVPVLPNAGWLQPSDIRRTVISLWRAPERLAAAAPWTRRDVTLVDLAAFGETGLLAAGRPVGDWPAPWKAGPLTIADGGPECAHVAQTQAGTLGIRGLLAAPRFNPYGTGSVAAEAAIVPTKDGHIDTGYPCRIVPDGLLVTAPPARLVSVGGYRFPLHDLQRMVRDIEVTGMLTALPHAISGHRLAGHATNPAAIRDMLMDMGANPLLAAAFRDRAA